MHIQLIKNDLATQVLLVYPIYGVGWKHEHSFVVTHITVLQGKPKSVESSKNNINMMSSPSATRRAASLARASRTPFTVTSSSTLAPSARSLHGQARPGHDDSKDLPQVRRTTSTYAWWTLGVWCYGACLCGRRRSSRAHEMAGGAHQEDTREEAPKHEQTRSHGSGVLALSVRWGGALDLEEYEIEMTTSPQRRTTGLDSRLDSVSWGRNGVFLRFLISH